MSCKVTLQGSRRQFFVEGGESVLDAALRQGVGLPYGCRGGFCGGCKGRLVEGHVNYDEWPAGLTREAGEAGEALLCRAHPVGDLVVEIAETDASTLAPARYSASVADLEQLAHDVMRVRLRLKEGDRMPFYAGQYVDIVMDDGRRRAFSLANAPHNDEFLELHIRHVEGGSYTRHVFETMRVGDPIDIEGPHGSFYLRESSERPIICIGGGTGFAPIKGILEHAFAERIANPIDLYWGVRQQRDLYLDQLPRLWAEENLSFRYIPVLSQEDEWDGRSGWVHEAVVADHPDLSGFDIYMSGPPAMIGAARDLFLAHGVPRDHLYSDAFEFSNDKAGAS